MAQRPVYRLSPHRQLASVLTNIARTDLARFARLRMAIARALNNQPLLPK